MQNYESKWHLVIYELHKLSPAQINYDIRDKKFLSIIECCKKWRHYLYGHKFEIVTDHDSLQYIPTQPYLTPRQIRAVEFMADYDYVIKYKPGKQNIVANALSKRPDYGQHWKARSGESAGTTKQNSIYIHKRNENSFYGWLKLSHDTSLHYASMCPLLSQVRTERNSLHSRYHDLFFY